MIDWARRSHNDAVRITSAHRSRTADVKVRQKRYLISMGIRTVCFLLAVVVSNVPLRVSFLIAAFVLPPVAVIVANAGSDRDTGGPEHPIDSSRPMLETRRSPDDDS
ncbi:MAG: DUF3099 domain-containing protein [Propionibacteriales bacterium]|nr:DUF3099 domain-containing protein [Propionibacteriales bacterium]